MVCQDTERTFLSTTDENGKCTLTGQNLTCIEKIWDVNGGFVIENLQCALRYKLGRFDFL